MLNLIDSHVDHQRADVKESISTPFVSFMESRIMLDEEWFAKLIFLNGCFERSDIIFSKGVF